MFSMVFLQIVINFIVAFVLVMAVMPKSIQYLKKLKFGQIEREEGLESHKAKGGTPTMGGIVFISISFITNSVLQLLIGGIVGCSFYLIFSYILKSDSMRELLSLIKR